MPLFTHVLYGLAILLLGSEAYGLTHWGITIYIYTGTTYIYRNTICSNILVPRTPLPYLGGAIEAVAADDLGVLFRTALACPPEHHPRQHQEPHRQHYPRNLGEVDQRVGLCCLRREGG